MAAPGATPTDSRQPLRKAPMLALLLLRLAVLPASAVRPDTLPLDARWEFTGTGGRIGVHLGRPALLLANGFAYRRDLALRDGTVDFDMAVQPHRSFDYIAFRMRSDEEHEEIYFRPQKSELSDAIQYAPVWRGQSAWQLFHAGKGTASAPIPAGRWVHVRLVLSGPRMALFLDAAAKPAMVARLAREPAAGYIAFRAFPNSEYLPDGSVVMAVSNVVVAAGEKGYEFGPEPPAAVPAPGLITRWQLSPAFPLAAAPPAALSDSLLRGKAAWPAFATEADGLLTIDRWLSRPQRLSGTVARLVLRSDAARLVPLQLGYSDFATVLVNGRPLFAGDAHYSYDDPRQDGVIGLFQARVWLPLARGENEVLVVVADQFGGWGLMGRLEPTAGVEMVGVR